MDTTLPMCLGGCNTERKPAGWLMNSSMHPGSCSRGLIRPNVHKLPAALHQRTKYFHAQLLCFITNVQRHWTWSRASNVLVCFPDHQWDLKESGSDPEWWVLIKKNNSTNIDKLWEIPDTLSVSNLYPSDLSVCSRSRGVQDSGPKRWDQQAVEGERSLGGPDQRAERTGLQGK